ncbi:MAG: peptidase [Catenulispora sp.]|nr:peptidase [Catenulispora sp.]
MKKKLLALASVAAASAVLVASGTTPGMAASAAGPKPPACSALTPTSPPPPAPTPTTDAVLEQAYYCLFEHYYSGKTLDDRVLLTGAFTGFVEALAKAGLDRSDAELPALTGRRDDDWTAFDARFSPVLNAATTDPAKRQQLLEAAIRGMLAALHDDHVRWDWTGEPGPPPPPPPPPGTPDQPYEIGYGLGIIASVSHGTVVHEPQNAVGPLYVKAIEGGPAAALGLRPGDVIESVDGAPPFVDGVLSVGAMQLLNPMWQENPVPIHLVLKRPATGVTWDVTATPQVYQLTPGNGGATAKLVAGDLVQVTLPAFYPGAADDVLKQIADMRKTHTVRGVILDFRDNGGGDPAEVTKLLGAFVHGAAYSYDCDARGKCTPILTDGTTPLLGLPLAVLTSRDCASGCDAFSGAVKDLHLGTLLGDRTAGVVSGPGQMYALTDGSILGMPSQHMLGADREVIDGIGVAPDRFVPLTADDVSAGRDPVVDAAVAVLH